MALEYYWKIDSNPTNDTTCGFLRNPTFHKLHSVDVK